MSQKVKTQTNQNLFDIAIQYCGDVSAASFISEQNDIPLTDDVPSGSDLILPDSYKPNMSSYFNSNNIQPATGDVTSLIAGGIDFMGIEINFIVS